MSNFMDAMKISDQYSADVRRLKESVPLLSNMRCSDVEVERLYERFSDSRCAGWLILDEETIAEFSAWLER